MQSAEGEDLTPRLVTQTAIWLAITGAILFLSAGTLNWPEAWIFLGIWLAGGLTSGLSLARTNPEIVKERMRSPLQQDQKPWDRPLILAIFGGWALLHVVAGLDAKRFEWSDMPIALEVLGAIAIFFAIYLFHIVMRENAYSSAVVKIDAGRGHKVISTGPYAWVRHPMYAGAIFYFLGTALLLGSWYAFVFGLVLIAVIAFRAVREERMLAAELPGYADYARRVKYRLVPGVW
ncbi:MAG TPA: isoprenylcysteine carboxylmethyltransferase family protein [Hyphomicrobium sp.]|jgi:protein-S-isoprenylcysteine O-methyltransferase Ste14